MEVLSHQTMKSNGQCLIMHGSVHRVADYNCDA